LEVHGAVLSDKCPFEAHFAAKGEKYKVELINDLPEGSVISIYKNGPFEDLCKGPHVESTKELGHFKLLRVAGAYWRGDSKNKMLQRIYGTAFANKDELQKYLKMIEEAEKRDHNKLGRELDLFVTVESIGQGLSI
jgi:threonyl-tRNA synthetase